jgi:hypothetical protein
MLKITSFYRFTAVFLLFFLLFIEVIFAQRKEVDNILTSLSSHRFNDTTKVELLSKLAFFYHQIAPDSTIYLSKKAFDLATELNYNKGKADALKHWAIGSYVRSYDREALKKTKRLWPFINH